MHIFVKRTASMGWKTGALFSGSAIMVVSVCLSICVSLMATNVCGDACRLLLRRRTTGVKEGGSWWCQDEARKSVRRG
jgi:hypothetical protein